MEYCKLTGDPIENDGQCEFCFNEHYDYCTPDDCLHEDDAYSEDGKCIPKDHKLENVL